MNKSYIDICKDLSSSSGILTLNERNAIGRLVEDAVKWRKYKEQTTVKSDSLKAVISYYLDIKEIPIEARRNVTHFLRPAKELLNKCNKDVEICKRVIDKIAVEFAELNWTLFAVARHADRIMKGE